MRDANRYDHNWYQNEMEQCENGDYVHYTDYATLLTRHNALVEALQNSRDVAAAALASVDKLRAKIKTLEDK